MIKKYEHYKDSGVEWLGEIPEHWDTTKIKFFFKNKNSIFIDGDWIENKDIGSDEVYYFTTGNIRELKFYDKERTFVSNQTFDKLNCTEIHENDILISRLNLPIGRCCLAPKFDKKAIVSVDVCVMRADQDYNRNFLVYVMNSPQYFTHTKNEARGAIMKRISRTILGNISLPIPPLPEQTAIANFLDDKTQKIDQAISIKEQQITLLKERKQILIHKAVTGQLIIENGKWIMTPKEKMKDSGVEWIGEIPEHWEVKRLKYCLIINNGSDYKNIQTDEGYPVIGSGGQFAYASDYMYDGEVVLLGRKGTIDKPLYFKGKFWAVDTMFYANAKNGNIVKFLYYVATTFPFSYYSTATALPSMTQSDLNNHPISLPSIEEQQEISDYIETASQKIDTAISLKAQEIEKLKEYKSSLINSVVTGKVKIIEN